MIISIVVFIYALVIGSFLNVCIYRIPNQKSIVFPASHCGHCGNTLKAKDLIPILSWVFLRGKCCYCGSPVSVRYALVELLTAIMVTGTYSFLGLSFNFFVASFLICMGIVITFIDLDHMIIPDQLNLLLAVGGVLYILVNGIQRGGFSFEPIMASLIGGSFLLLIAFLGAMGGGDIKYAAAMGLYMNPGQMVIGLYLSFIVGGIVALTLLLLGKVKRKMEIPFGPYLVLGITSSFIFGESIWQYYLSLVSF